MEIERIPKNKLLLLNKKYIFHGSPDFFDTCKPNKANCDTKNPANEYFAVYGCEYVEPAILFAFTKKSINRNKEAYWKVDFDKTNTRAKLYNMYINNNIGYIYCFDKKNFELCEQGNEQWISKTEQKPIHVFCIDYNDFKYLFNIISEIDL